MVGVISALLSQGQLQANPIAASNPITIRAQTSRKNISVGLRRAHGTTFCIFLSRWTTTV
jgi:hypothetical protein